MADIPPDSSSPQRRRVRRRIGELLMRHGKMPPQQATDVVVKQLNGDRRQFGRIATEHGYATNEDLWEIINAEKAV